MKQPPARWVRVITTYLSMHLFLTIASLPILMAWGVPLSRLSVIGNLVFNPMLSLFLLLSSLLFFCEIVHIPHGAIAWLLDKLTALWRWTLSFHGHNNLYGFGKPTWIFLLLLAIVPFAFIAHPRTRSSLERVIGLSLLFVLCVIILETTQPTLQNRVRIPCPDGELTLLVDRGKIILIDPGVLGKRISAPSFATYTLTPELIAQTGKLVIDHLILCKPNVMTLEAVRALSQTITIRSIYIPYLAGVLSGSLLVAWAKLYEALSAQHTVMHRLYKHKPRQIHEESIQLTVRPGANIVYRDVQYPSITIEGSIGQEPFHIGTA